MTVRPLSPNQAKLDLVEDSAQASTDDKMDLAVSTSLIRTGFGYIKRSGQLALAAWSSLNQWLDEPIFPQPDRTKKRPYKPYAIQLEDRILYSAGPLSAIFMSSDPSDVHDPNSPMMPTLADMIYNDAMAVLTENPNAALNTPVQPIQNLLNGS